MGDMTGPKAPSPVKDGEVPQVVTPIKAGIDSSGPGDGMLAPGPTLGGGTIGGNAGGFVGK